MATLRNQPRGPEAAFVVVACALHASPFTFGHAQKQPLDKPIRGPTFGPHEQYDVNGTGSGGTAVKVARTLALLSVTLVVSACVAGPPPGPMGVVAPGKDKSQAAFQQDQSVCQQHAVAQTGYGEASQNPADHPPPNETPPGPGSFSANATPPSSAGAAVPPGTEVPGEMSYLQCMAARGDIVQMTSAGGYSDSGYGYPYAYGYPYYGYDYPLYGGLIAGWGGWYGWRHGGWGHGYWGHGGWGHGGWGHGGWGHGGWGGHGGFGHGGFGHGGFGHGGGGGGHR
jgi:hypothetical protein